MKKANKKKRTPKVPKRFSTLILQALNDLALVERQKNLYEVSMGTWFSTDYSVEDGKERCHVCFAGSVMAMTHKLKPHQDGGTARFSTKWWDAFSALDSLRKGNVADAIYKFHGQTEKAQDLMSPFLGNAKVGEILDDNYPHDFESYEEDPKVFKEQILDIAYMLKANGL